MFHRLRFGLVLCLGLFAPALVGCEDDDDVRPAETEESLTDAEIIAVVVAINAGEIEQGELARTRGARGDVRAYGAQMVVAHADATVRLGDLMAAQDLASLENDLSRTVAAEAAAGMSRLNAVSDDAFDRHYIANQLAMHSRALSLLRDRLLPEADDDALVLELEAMEAAVEAHLDEAQRIGTALGDDVGAVDPGEGGGEIEG